MYVYNHGDDKNYTIAELTGIYKGMSADSKNQMVRGILFLNVRKPVLSFVFSTIPQKNTNHEELEKLMLERKQNFYDNWFIKTK